jgi:protoheme IX farnesyltransferase
MDTGRLKEILKTYYHLCKPGIVRGNVFTAAAGYFLAVGREFNLPEFLAMASGLALVIASACVCNNLLDRGIDQHMERTKKRALVTGTIKPMTAMIFAAVLLIAGTLLLYLFTTPLAAYLALFGVVAYVIIYGHAKRTSVHGTLIGSISGAVPPVVGYTAGTGTLDTAALLLFLVLVFWQMPHFYSIAIYRLKDYKAARIPVFPAVFDMWYTKIQIVCYIAAFTAAVLSLTFLGYASVLFAIVISVISIIWFWKSLKGFRIKETAQLNKWAGGMFGWSLVTLTTFSVAIAIDSLI